MADLNINLNVEIAAAKARAKKSAPKSLGTRIWENVVGDDDPTTQNFGEKVGTALNMAGEAMTFGLIGDEASGAVAGMIPGGMNAQERTDYERQQQAMLEESNPGVALTSQIAGGLMAPLAVATSVPSAVAWGAGGGFTYGGMEGEGGLKERAPGAYAGGLIGGAAGGASVPLGKVLQWAGRKLGKAGRTVFANKKLFDGKTLSKEGRETLEALGYNVDELSDDFVKTFQQRTKELPAESAGRAAGLDEFGIPVYRHNVTGTVDDFAAFERAKRGALGPRVEQRVRDAADRQVTATTQAADDISAGMSGGVRGDQYDAAVSVQEGLRKQQAAARGAASKAYDDLAATGGGIPGSRGVKAGTVIKDVMVKAGRQIDDSATPNTAGALREIDSLFSGAEKGSIPFMQLERGRQTLNRYLRAAQKGAKEADASALREAIEGYDQFVDDAMTSALIDGDKKAIDAAAKNARALWQKYSQQFQGKGAASKFVQKMVDEDASTDDMVKWLFSSGKLGSGRFNSTIAKGLKDILGEGSDEWGMVRQAAFRQLWQKPEGTVQFGPQAMSTRINEFLNSPATRALSREIFAPEQIAQMRRYSAALKRMVPPEGAVNYSNTAYENARIVRQAFNGLMTAMGAASGGPSGAVGAMAATKAAGGAKNALAGRALMSPTGTASRPVGAASLGILGGEVGSAAGPKVAEIFGYESSGNSGPMEITVGGRPRQ